MDDNNQNKTNPFGAYRYGDGGPNRPRDISSDLWTPISTGVPMQGTHKLQDENETPPAPQPVKKPRQKFRSPSESKLRPLVPARGKSRPEQGTLHRANNRCAAKRRSTCRNDRLCGRSRSSPARKTGSRTAAAPDSASSSASSVCAATTNASLKRTGCNMRTNAPPVVPFFFVVRVFTQFLHPASL